MLRTRLSTNSKFMNSKFTASRLLNTVHATTRRQGTIRTGDEHTTFSRHEGVIAKKKTLPPLPFLPPNLALNFLFFHVSEHVFNM